MKKSVVLVRTALFSAIIAVLSQITIPFPTGVPLTLQTFAIALCGFCLNKKEACASIAVYIALGAIGIPVFSGFQAGLPRVIGPTGGFMVGFFPLALLCGIKCEKNSVGILLGEIGLALCHLCGVLYYSLLMDIGFVQSFLAVSAPFLIKDFISVTAAFFVSKIILRHIS